MEKYRVAVGLYIEKTACAMRIRTECATVTYNETFIITSANAHLIQLGIKDRRSVQMNGTTVYYNTACHESSAVYSALSLAIFLFLSNEKFPDTWKEIGQ